MNGFITESVSKLSDGFGTALYLLGLVFSTRFLNRVIEKYFGYTGFFIFTLLLLVLAIFSLGRGISKDQDDPNSAGYGITSGVLLWQVLIFFSLIGNLRIFSIPVMILWAIAGLITLMSWRKISSKTIRFFLLVFLMMWGGFIFIEGNNLAFNWQPIWNLVFFSGRLAALAGTLVFSWWIVFKSVNSENRKIAGVLLGFSAMLAGLWF